MQSLRLAAALLGGLCSCFPFGQIEKDRDAAEKLASFHFRNVELQRPEGPGRLGYRITGEGSLLIVLIHGAPGSWDGWAGFLKRPADFQARLMAVDRPGYGSSGEGHAEPSLARQAALIAAAVRKEKNGPVILAGHSMGGPVAARIAMDFPDLCEGLVFVAASVDPELEVLEWYHRAADARAVRWMLPRDVDTANQEILPLKQELTEMLPLWEKLRLPAVIIQGGQDTLVPPGNARFLARHLPEAELVFVPDMNHFVPWSRPDLIDAAILRVAEKLRDRKP
jgi:pimeloyl-ACP methyl ester carboxylesterase